MSEIQLLNSNTYRRDATTSSLSIQLTAEDAQNDSFDTWIIQNLGTSPVFVVGGITAPTAVYPADSATVATEGKVVAPGHSQSYERGNKHAFLSMISQLGTNQILVSIGKDK